MVSHLLSVIATNPIKCPSIGMISVSHLSSMVLVKAQLSQHRNGCSVTSLERDSGNTLSCPSIEMVAVSHVSSVIAAIHSVVPVLELLRCHISEM